MIKISHTVKLLRFCLFSLLGVTVLVGQLLVPGYVLLLDWIAGPTVLLPYTNISNFIYAPSNIPILFLSLFMHPWVVQKMLLLGVVFSLFFVPLIYFPWTQYRLAPYFVSLLAVVNPFVYERLLAGQWRVLVGYVCLFPLFYYLFKFRRDGSRQSALGICLTLLFTGMWSIHFLAIGIVVTMIYLGAYFISLLKAREVNNLYARSKNILLVLVLFLVCSLYWIIPLAILGSNQLENFTDNDYSAFTTTRDPNIGVVLNVLTLRGFWATGEGWGEQFKLPGDNAALFYTACVGIFILLIIGWLTLRRQIEQRFEANLMLILLVCATIFATGVSAYGLWQINYWLLENIPFWNGFRDAQKWVGVITGIYSLLFGIAIATVIQKLPRFKYTISALAVVLVFSISPYQLFGLGGQVTPVWYPAEWSEIDLILKDVEDCTAVFLPWHQYYAVAWNNSQLISNPATRAFSCTVNTSQNTELGTLRLPGVLSERDQSIENAITNNSFDSEQIARSIQQLKTAGVKYIIYSNDIADTDIYLYPILQSSELELLYDSETIQLYRII